jgi:molecular chaperone GrpE (heat shock protein)
MMVSEDDSLSEFINQEAIREVKKEISELEKKYMAAEADYNNMKK